MTRSAKINTIPGGKNLRESLLVAIIDGGKPLETLRARRDEPMALQREDTASPRVGKTGLQYKFQRSSATVTYSQS
jgi:hypothetical protein